MPPALANRTIALAEGRQLEDLARLLEAEGAVVYRCPLISILDPPDDAPALAWLQELIQDRFDLVVFLTGEGVRRLLACAERRQLRDSLIQALGRTRILTRGPKPARALKEIQISPALSAGQPTSEGVVQTLRNQDLSGKTVGVQLYRPENPVLLDFLHQAGAKVATVLPYLYAPAADAVRVLELIQALHQGKMEVLVFTSSPQVDRLFEVAEDHQQEEVLKEALLRTRIAAVGPIVADNLRDRGFEPAICPEQGFVMKNLVQHIKRAFST